MARRNPLKALCAAFVVASAVILASILASVPSEAAGQRVAFDRGFARGTIVIRTNERRLYYVIRRGKALSYPVGVGRDGRQWAGTAFINGKHLRPAWKPPDAIKRERPNVVDFIPSGSPSNPMGAAAMTLSGGDYAIHGTNAPETVGSFVSYGCIRMFNEDITELFGRVRIGTRVVVTE
jgi:lipoprotein-anchoring transpeptidase ErfK/SrfK